MQKATTGDSNAAWPGQLQRLVRRLVEGEGTRIASAVDWPGGSSRMLVFPAADDWGRPTRTQLSCSALLSGERT